MITFLLAALAAAVEPGDVALAKRGLIEAQAKVHRGEIAQPLGRDAPPLGRFLAAMGMTDEQAAWKELKQLQLDAPELPWGEIGMGRIYAHWKLWDQADNAFARALRLHPRSPIALVELAIADRAAGRSELARKGVQEALAQDPHDARALLLLAQLDDDARAPLAQRKAGYAAALAEAPDLVEASQALAAIAEQQGDDAAALKATVELAQDSPRDARLWRKVASLRARTGDKAGAAQALEETISLGLVSRELLLELAGLEQQLARAPEEEQALRRLHRLDPKDRSVLLRLLALTGSEADAKALLELDPRDATAHLFLAGKRAGDPFAQLTELTLASSGRGDDAPRARAQLEGLRKDLGVPEKPISAPNLNLLYGKFTSVLSREYDRRRKLDPQLAGHLTLRVQVNGAGKAEGVEVVRRELPDKLLVACMQATLSEALYPREQKKLSFRFDLRPPKGEKMQANSRSEEGGR